ncbi:DUF3592 domain-containing protein [Lacrimispora sp.]|uniref:DUF3592 domain-containing protein n=1 Tax=Lacrimispora sp. TaxID=2719234 RepID=UPI00289AE97A|nr:DUF3592 domain-containing protein [Lacrimispora sp.]
MYGITFGLGFIGLFFLGVVIYSFVRIFRYRQACTLIGAGTVKDVISYGPWGAYFPVVSYEVENKVYQTRPVFGYRRSKWQVDQKIMILYNAKNPSVFFIADTTLSKWFFWILGCVGVICVTLAIGFTIPSFVRGAYRLIGKSGVQFLQKLSICSSIGGILAGGITGWIHWRINKGS